MLGWFLGLLGVVVAGFVKGAIGFGFPTIATPILALTTDVRTAVVVLLLPNIIMDGFQIVRRPGLLAAARRHAPLIACGVMGMVLGTQFLVRVSPRGLLVATVVALAAFTVGLRVQDRVLSETFNRAVLGFLALVSVAMLARALWS